MTLKTKMIIDTDPGIDDAMAILYAGLHPDIDLLGLTTVFGNVTTEIATRNALVLTEMMNLTIPVAEGAHVPLTQAPNAPSSHVHGTQGFGNHPAMHPKGQAITTPAAQFICDTIHANPHEIVLCPIGPLTNIAEALAHDPTIASKVKSVIIMGGAVHAKGNVTPYAEANVWNDPHAVAKVFEANWDVTMIGLDVTAQIVCPVRDFEQILPDSPILGDFLLKAVKFYDSFYRTNLKIDGCQMHDPTTIIAAIAPRLFKYETEPLRVILDGTRVGQTSVDMGMRAIRFATGADIDAVKNDFFTTLKRGH